jgi:NAD-dependent deacetylase
VVTQNVDGLHQQAGSQDVVEVHGTVATASCVRCGRSYDRDRVAELLPLPSCESCGNVLKPDVVMFGELLPEEAVHRATELARRARLLLIVGSSLEVWPVAGLPEETLAHGGRLAIVNRDPTPYDEGAALVVHATAGEVLGAAVDLLSG